MTVTVLGSGTSSGVPVVACDCAVCTSPRPHNHRLRSSIVLRGVDRTILVDCGSDFRQQALQHRLMRMDAVLLTHAHSDHISGMDELRMYNWKQGRAMPLFASEETLAALRKRFDYIFDPPQVGGGVPQLDLRVVRDEEPFNVIGLRVEALTVLHGLLPVQGFRFGDFAYITDASHVPADVIARLRGVRTLILNALRHRPHPTHLTVAQAVEVARAVGAQQTYFTHITHDLDHDETNAQLPPGMALAHDGLDFPIQAEAFAAS